MVLVLWFRLYSIQFHHTSRPEALGLQDFGLGSTEPIRQKTGSNNGSAIVIVGIGIPTAYAFCACVLCLHQC